MICSSCRRIFQSRIGTLRNPISASASASTSIISPSIRRHYASTAPATPNAAPSEPSPSITGATAADVASGTQPSSDAQKTSSTPVPTTGEVARKPRKLKGSVPAGQELKGLGYTKAKPFIKAMEDHEYPDWLWTLLDESAKPGEVAVDLAGKLSSRTRYPGAGVRATTKKKKAFPHSLSLRNFQGTPANLSPLCFL